jgi:hypothetical protein
MRGEDVRDACHRRGTWVALLVAHVLERPAAVGRLGDQPPERIEEVEALGRRKRVEAKYPVARLLASATVVERAVCSVKCSVVAKDTAAPIRSPSSGG